jgi:hypothetical protein
LPIDQRGADLLFQVISQRYERGSIVITSNKAFKQWPLSSTAIAPLPPPSSTRTPHDAAVVLLKTDEAFQLLPKIAAFWCSFDVCVVGFTFGWRVGRAEAFLADNSEPSRSWPRILESQMADIFVGCHSDDSRRHFCARRRNLGILQARDLRHDDGLKPHGR